ncbi:hypothetical protein ACFSGI_08845 [Paenibacillus nicotianae]|uniref:Uncharacterized protein n=1 Tax=Paenibacillus nicotianae TaxID=1526551 RepID=A0ABW4UT32_9BACL
MEGWIKLHRKMMDNPVVCKDSDHIAVWMYLLLNATHKEYPVLFAGEKIILQPGQLITGRQTISVKLKISESKAQRILKTFESEQQIEQQKSNKNRLISILSWHDYQESEQQNEQQLNNKRTTTEQQVNTNKNVKNIKNDKNVEKEEIKTSRHKRVYDMTSIPYRSANYLFKKILEINPDAKPPNMQKWADDMRLLIENDKRDKHRVAEVIDWIFNDPFWQTNILSPAKLRKQYDTIDTKMKGLIANGKHGGHAQTVERQNRESPYAFLDENKPLVSRVVRDPSLL